MHRLHCMLSQLLFTWILSSIYQTPKYRCFNCVLSGKKTNSQGLFRTVTPFNGQESGTRELLVEIEPSITCDWFSVSMKLATRMYYVFIFVPVVKLSLKETEKV